MVCYIFSILNISSNNRSVIFNLIVDLPLFLVLAIRYLCNYFTPITIIDGARKVELEYQNYSFGFYSMSFFSSFSQIYLQDSTIILENCSCRPGAIVCCHHVAACLTYKIENVSSIPIFHVFG